MRSRIRLLLVAGFGLVPALASADWNGFIPVPLQNDVVLDLFYSHEHDSFGGIARSLSWTDAFAKERLSLASQGYVYHPRFLRYRATLSGLLSQEKYEAVSFAPRAWNGRTGAEYDVTLSFLPDHPGNLTLFASRFEPLFKEQAATSHDRVGKILGSRFQYEKRPYFVRAGLVSNTTDFGDFSSDVRRANLEAKYFKEMRGGKELGFDLAFNPVWTSGSTGLRATSHEAYAANTLKLGGFRLSSNLTDLNWDQRHGTTGDDTSDQFVWQERLTARLPRRFRSDVTYRYHDNDSRFRASSESLLQTLQDKGDTLQADLIHRLYESVDTTYSLLRDARESADSRTTSLSQSLTVNYNKRIPAGALTVGLSGSRGDLDSAGPKTSVVNESHPAVPVPGSFTLGQLNAVPSSITVLLKSPIPPFELVPLTEDVHYSVFPFASTLEIRVFALPAEFVVPGSYDFLVSYSLAGGDFSLRNNAFSSSASVKLFGEFLTTYAGYATAHTDVLSGAFPGIPVNSKSYTAGVRLARGPWRANGEYANLDWDVSPRETWNARLEYSGTNPASSARLFGAAAYTSSHYRRGDIGFQTTPFTESIFTVTANVQKRLRSRRMVFTGGGSYSRLERLVSADALSWNATWTWKVGRVELDAGASVYRYYTSGTSVSSYDRHHELYYVKLRRALF